MNITLNGLLSSSPIHCPSCNTRLATMDSQNVVLDDPDGYLTEDGDTIPGAPADVGGAPALCLASVGRCAACAGKHWMLEVYIHQSGVPAIIDALEQDYPWAASYLVSGSDHFWSLHRFQSPQGTGWAHNIGPIKAPDQMPTHGPLGVSSCSGSDFWRYAKSVTEDLMAKILTAQTLGIGLEASSPGTQE